MRLAATAALFTGAAPDAPPRYPDLTVIALTASPDGGWYWLAEKMAYHHGGKVIFGMLTGDGDPMAAEYVESTGATSSAAMLYAASPFEVDDHANPAFLRRTDGKILAVYTIHTGAAYTNISTNADDATAWGTNVNITSQLGFTADPPHGVTYPGLAQVGDDIYLFLRFHDVALAPRLSYSVSRDDGVTWSELVEVVDQTYHRMVQDGDRIHFMLSGHPVFTDWGEYGIHHVYFEGGSWYASDGSEITATQPFAISEATEVYDGSIIRAWLWDIATDPVTGHPIMVFATFAGGDGTDHRYQYARWNGSAWTFSEMAEAGAGITVTPRFEDAGEEWYSGGVALDHTDPRIVYASIQTGAGRWDINRYITLDGGTSWVSSALTSSGKNIRPYVVRDRAADGLQVLWGEGTFTNYIDYALRTMGAKVV